jgi:hypothetical protein
MSLTKVTNSMISGAPPSVFDWLTADLIAEVQSRTPTTNITSQVQAAVNYAITNRSGILEFPSGVYLIDSLEITRQTAGVTAALTLQGTPTDLSLNGTILKANSVQTNFIKIVGPTINLVISDFTIDGQCKVNNTINFTTSGVDTTSYNRILNCFFYNVVNDGYFINAKTTASAYNETAIVEVDTCSFTANQQFAPYNNYAKAAINLENAGAWGWNITNTHFDGQNNECHLRLYAGGAKIDNCQFDNTSAAGTYDIHMWGSFQLNITGCNSGSAQTFLRVEPKVVTTIWDNFPINIFGSQHYRPSGFDPSIYSIYYNQATNPLYITGFKTNSKGVGINGAGGGAVPEKMVLTGTKYISTVTPTGDVTQYISQGTTNNSYPFVISDNSQFRTLRTYYVEPTNRFVTETNGVGLGSLPYSIGADPLELTEALLQFDLRTTLPTNSPAASAQIFLRLSGGKHQLCCAFPTGAIQVIATEP